MRMCFLTLAKRKLRSSLALLDLVPRRRIMLLVDGDSSSEDESVSTIDFGERESCRE